nr:hypothetical protein Itr_chr08CG18010 [Ipomoea trifida]
MHFLFYLSSIQWFPIFEFTITDFSSINNTIKKNMLMFSILVLSFKHLERTYD